jgi:2-succinyl-6-hydroxy-2,4-cyclohexadiene-1-carboxylate synthase
MPPPLVLLHGFTNTGASWERVAAALGERYRPIAPDIRGHGAAGAQRPVTLEAVIDDISGLSDEPFALAGYSMGGRIALHAAFALAGGRVPGGRCHITRLWLIGASPGLRDPGDRAARQHADDALADEIETSTIEAFAHRWAQTPVLADQPADVRRAVDADRRRNSPAGLAAALRGLGTGVLPSLWDRLPALEIPVTLVVGERDAKFRATAEQMAAALPDAALRVVPGAGHAVHLENPAAVAAIIAGDTSR